MRDWFTEGLVDDVRPHLFECRQKGIPAALATIVAADGGPRPIGSQMVIVEDRFWGFLSGGCIEDDVALNARRVLDDGEPLVLVYGHGSPFIDMRLPCGGRIEVLMERIEPADRAVLELERLWHARIPAQWRSDGLRRQCHSIHEDTIVADPWLAELRFDPPWRLVVVGEDPFALAIAGMGQMVGFETRLLAPFASKMPPPFDLTVDRRGLATALSDPAPDGWTATILATHDIDLDLEALALLLKSDAGYIGVIGARRRIPDRVRGLRDAGFREQDIARICMPLGLPIRARSPWEVAISALGEIIAARRATP